MPLCRFCGQVETDQPACDACKGQILAARNARETLEARTAQLEANLELLKDHIEFIMNFFRPAVPSPIVGAPPTVTSLGELYRKQKQAKLEAATAQPTGRITHA